MLQGDVLSQLKRLNIYRPGMGQGKLHSKFYQAEDGYLYFSRFDEKGEASEINPTWGGHLWRKLPHSVEWEQADSTLKCIGHTGITIMCSAINLAGVLYFSFFIDLSLK